MNKTFSIQVENILGSDLKLLESASMRHNAFLKLGDNNTKHELDCVATISKNHSIFPYILPGDHSFDLTLGGRLLINMSTGVIENAGIALHRHFNCPFIPGSALKGIARHQAWCEWIASSGDSKTQINEYATRIFGSSLHQGRKKIDTCRGNICFLDAYPASTAPWELISDVLAPHGGNDYTNPIPCFFIAVEKGAIFNFRLIKNSTAIQEDVSKAGEWLKKGLYQHGIGAKTISGYGWFIDSNTDEYEVPVKLISPGFFGGASLDSADDTTLRASSLRGMLRWWWRILYRDRLSEQVLNDLQDFLWGSTSASGLIRIRVVGSNENKVELFNYKDGWKLNSEFAQKNGINPDTSGLLYLAYGMDEKSQRVPRQRFYCHPGNKWVIRFSVRNKQETYFSKLGDMTIELSKDDILKQAMASLSLLCHFGGIGSKSRNGFGSLQMESCWSLDKCIANADEFMNRLGLSQKVSNSEYSFSTAIISEIAVPCNNAWTVLDRLGLAVSSFATKYKHNAEKVVLGLPRKIHGPFTKPTKRQSQSTHQKPKPLIPSLYEARNGNKTRFASPVFYHLERANENIIVRIIAFPSGKLGPLNTSHELLEALKNDVIGALDKFIETPTVSSTNHRQPSKQSIRVQSINGLVAGQETSATLLEERTKKGGWRVRINGTEYQGPIVNSNEVPSQAKVGDVIKVKINSANQKSPSFRWICSP